MRTKHLTRFPFASGASCTRSSPDIDSFVRGSGLACAESPSVQWSGRTESVRDFFTKK
jgi:hypothetical protein